MKFLSSLDIFNEPAKEIPCITGSGAPAASTEGAVGSLYMDTDTSDIYKCTAVSEGVYTWELHNGTSAANVIHAHIYESDDTGDTGYYACDVSAARMYEVIEQGGRVVLHVGNGGPFDELYLPTDAAENLVTFACVSDDNFNYSWCIWDSDGGTFANYSDTALASYDENGRLTTGDPVEPYECANKRYVDNAVKGKSYELIETFTVEEPTVIERTKEPTEKGGAPYKFDRVYIGFDTTLAVDATGTNTGFVRFFSGNTCIGQAFCGAAGKGYYKAHEIQIEGGSWRTTWCDWGTNSSNVNGQTFSNNFGYYPDKSAQDYPYVDRIVIANICPANTVIKIWGVRANA